MFKLTKVDSTWHQRTTNCATSSSKSQSHRQTNKKHPAFKWKSPSRRCRDQERFRLFLERKKARKVQNAVSKQPSVAAVQCPPPSELTVPAHIPPTITLDKPPTADIPPTATLPQEPDIVSLPSPQNSLGSPCVCEICTVLKDVEPFSEEYGSCHNCGKPNTDECHLKPCAQCLGRAYCSRECQRGAWKTKHQAECSKDLGEKIRAVRKNFRRHPRSGYISVWNLHMSCQLCTSRRFPSTQSTRVYFLNLFSILLWYIF